MKGERTPEESRAANPVAGMGCSCSAAFTIFDYEQKKQQKPKSDKKWGR